MKNFESPKPSRRAFLTSLGAAGFTSALAVTGASAAARLPAATSIPANRYVNRFQLRASGVVAPLGTAEEPLPPMVWPWPPPTDPPFELPEESVLSMEFLFPVVPTGGRRVADVLQVTVSATNMGTGLPDPFLISVFQQKVEKITLGTKEGVNFFAMYGPIISNSVESPFGNLVGLPALSFGNFDAAGDETQFTMLGGVAAGSHATAAPIAGGKLQIRGPWKSF
jgi:hypothetical protein